MGYVNKDARMVNVTKAEKKIVKRMARRAWERELNHEHPRSAIQATRRGWWYA